MGRKKESQSRIFRLLLPGIAAGVVLVFSTFPSWASDRLHEAVSDSMEEHEINYHASRIRIGGWSDFVYQDRDTDGYRQILDPAHLLLFFDAQLDDQWRSYAELEIEHLALQEGSDEGEGEIKVERLYLEYYHSDEVIIWVGKFYTSLGIWTREHWSVNVPSVILPIHEEEQFVPNKQVGVEVFGHRFLPFLDLLDYTFWISTGEDIFGTHEPTDNKFAYGADINLTFRETAKVGFTGYLQRNPEASGRREETLFPYAELYLPGEITLTGEYLHQSRDTGFDNVMAWYAAVKWQALPDTYLYYRFDKGEDDEEGLHSDQVITLGYWPRPYVRTKLEFSTHDFDADPEEDFNQWNAWIGVIF